MFEKLSDNLNLLMAEVHISADELARRTGVTASTIKKIRNRYNPNPTLTTLLPLAQFFSLTLGQLAGDEPLPENRAKGIYQSSINSIRQVPILTWSEAITWPHSKHEHHQSISTEYRYSDDAFALIVEDEDWENLSKGTTLLVDPQLKPESRDYAIVYKEGQPIPTLKQILYDEGEIFLKPMLYGCNIVALSSTHKILGVVVEYKKYLKTDRKIIDAD
jgi:SOS-response transcriptional repressor LexA